MQIHDPKRKDRNALTKTWTRPFGISLEVFPAIMNSNGAKGCFQSHVALASQINSPHYFVLEDDAVPTQDAHTNIELIAELEQCIQQDKYDIIWLGGLPTPNTNFFRFKTSGLIDGMCLTTYAMYVGPKAKKLLSRLEYAGVPIDVVLSKSKLKGAYANPPLFRQACTPSDIGKSEFTRGKLFAFLLEKCTPLWRFGVVYQNYLGVFILFYLLLHIF